MAKKTLGYQDLQPQDILGAVESLGFTCDGRFLALNSYENRVYQINLEDRDPIVAKFYRPGRWTNDAILEEHEFTQELADAEIPVVDPIVTEGKTLHEYNDFRFAVFERRGGRTPELDNLSLQRQIGRLVARIHLVGARQNFDHRPHINMDTYGIASANYLLESKLLPEELVASYESACEYALEGIDDAYARTEGIQTLRVHADFHPSNVLTQDEQIHIVDLDDTRMGPAVQDLWMFLSGDRQEQTPQLETLLEGYTEFREFDLRELHLIEALRTLRIMHYAAWLAHRWTEPAFQHAFPWFNTQQYWEEHILSLKEQIALVREEPLRVRI